MHEKHRRQGRRFHPRMDGLLTRDLVHEPCEIDSGKAPGGAQPDDTMVCGFCSTGCGLDIIHPEESHGINFDADVSHPVNGVVHPGGEALTPHQAPDRATTPLIHRQRDGALDAIDWESALTIFCERLKEIPRVHGPESVAFPGAGQIVTEKMAFAGALFKFGMGFAHSDSNARQYTATPPATREQSFGLDAPPYTGADFEESDTLVFIGSNPCIAHPIVWQSVMRNKHGPEIIIIDPRKTETAMAATQHYAIQPESDLTLLYGIANILIASSWIDRSYIDAHTNGFDEFAQFLTHFTTDLVSASTGLDADDIWHLAQTIADGKRVSFCWTWTTGVNQGHEATPTAQAIFNLALMTGITHRRTNSHIPPSIPIQDSQATRPAR